MAQYRGYLIESEMAELRSIANSQTVVSPGGPKRR